ncbi:MAG: hypothetical protein WCP03_00705 [Candidatus Saccharibacteria bacterium]
MWTTNLFWHPKLNAYIWTVENTLEETSEPGYFASGQIISINAGDGTVISIDSWEAQS